MKHNKAYFDIVKIRIRLENNKFKKTFMWLCYGFKKVFRLGER